MERRRRACERTEADSEKCGGAFRAESESGAEDAVGRRSGDGKRVQTAESLLEVAAGRQLRTLASIKNQESRCKSRVKISSPGQAITRRRDPDAQKTGWLSSFS